MDAQEDLKKNFRTLARQVAALQGGRIPGPISQGSASQESAPPEGSTTMVMDVDELKTKVTRLQEQVDQHNRHLIALGSVLHRLDQGQVEHWRNRLEPQSMDAWWIHTSIELQEQLQAFIRGDRARIQEIRDGITGIEERVNVLRRSRDDIWEVVSDRVTSEVNRVSAMLNERVAEVERVVQTRSASPATTVEQNPTIHEDIAKLDSRIEAGFGAFSREAEPRD